MSVVQKQTRHSVSTATTNTTVCFTKVYIEAGSFYSPLIISRTTGGKVIYLLLNIPLKAVWGFILGTGSDNF